MNSVTVPIGQFLLTRPLRDVTKEQGRMSEIKLISTHTPLAGRDSKDETYLAPIQISTHTPLAGRDA